MKSLKVACIGEVMMELVATTIPGTARIGVAGDVLNTAIYLRRTLPAKHSVSLVSLLGSDHFSDEISRFVQAEGIGINDLGRIEGRLPGVYAIVTDPSGERSFQYWRHQSAARLLFQQNERHPFQSLEKYDVVYASAITLAILDENIRHAFLNWLPTYRTMGGKFVFDSNYRPSLWPSKSVALTAVEAAWRQCDIALPSLDDELTLFDEISEHQVVKRFQTYGIENGALKRGHRGPLCLKGPQPDKQFQAVDKVVDTTAAGDGFNGGFLGRFLQTGDTSVAMKYGHSLASQIVMHSGAIIPKESQPA